MRNHGDSPSTPSMTYIEMAADLIQTIKKHQAPNTILMGHSMGGKAAMLVAFEQVIIQVKKDLFVLSVMLDVASTSS